MSQAIRWTLAAITLAYLTGCQTQRSSQFLTDTGTGLAGGPSRSPVSSTYPDAEVVSVSHTETDAVPPPRVRDISLLEPWPMSVDEALRLALENSPIIRSAGGRVLDYPGSLRTTLDPAILASDPNIGPEAALAAFDTHLETGLFWNGGGRMVGSAFSSGAFGVFSQPTTMAKVGLGRTLQTGTKLTLGGVGGYDQDLAGGAYAAFGCELRHPLARGAGREFNSIAGPYSGPGNYRGVWLTKLDAETARLELEQAVRDLARAVAVTYWELHFAYQNLEAKQVSLEHALQSWQRERDRLAEQAGPPDVEALARQQYFAADAAVQNAIGGTGRDPAGVYGVEGRLRGLLGLPATDGKLIRPQTNPLEAKFHFDWSEAIELAYSRRVELRKQRASLEKRELELRAARNLCRPQIDVVGQYRTLGDDQVDRTALFSEPLHGWQLGVELNQPLGSRREHAAERNSKLRLSRERAQIKEQEREVAAQLRSAFTELDRAYGVTQSLAASRDAARVHFTAETQRYAAGDVPIERVLGAQTRDAEAETAYQRSLVDYNVAFIELHFARGSLLDMLGVGFSADTSGDETSFASHGPSTFEASGRDDRAVQPKTSPAAENAASPRAGTGKDPHGLAMRYASKPQSGR